MSALIMLNVAVFAPMPNARDKTATIVVPGVFAKTLLAYLISCMKSDML
jgi:hypothetical protein